MTPPDEPDEKVVELPGERQRTPPPTARPGRVHGLATVGLAVCAVIGILASLLFVTVGWPGRSGRYVIGVVIIAMLGFFLCASIAIFAAARDTYARSPRSHDSGE